MARTERLADDALPGRERPRASSPGSREEAPPTEAARAEGEATADASTATLASGTRVARYRIVAPIGRGGFGVVYRAHDPQLDRDIALKLLRTDQSDAEARARLLREARAAARIRHPNVVAIHDADEVDGRVYIAMELIDGHSLRAWLRAEERDWREVVDVFLAAGEGLRAAHDAGIVHRDFKPDNVLIERSGRVRVLDFGLARASLQDDAAPTKAMSARTEAQDLTISTVTRSGMLIGTPAYMAPEQCRGQVADARIDQFSFCVA
ncbi:MAG: serine/threonine protein kinase, partial [Myxococcales bacterium]|nr:serine/threonine protein kinase [Myxococcales bacterium]